jgi:hypothetical protein
MPLPADLDEEGVEIDVEDACAHVLNLPLHPPEVMQGPARLDGIGADFVV